METGRGRNFFKINDGAAGTVALKYRVFEQLREY